MASWVILSTEPVEDTLALSVGARGRTPRSVETLQVPRQVGYSEESAPSVVTLLLTELLTNVVLPRYIELPYPYELKLLWCMSRILSSRKR